MRALLRLLCISIAVSFVAPTSARAGDSDGTEDRTTPGRSRRSGDESVIDPLKLGWDLLGRSRKLALQKLSDWGIELQLDLTIFDQYASAVVANDQNHGSFSWLVMGDWRLFDLTDRDGFGWLGKGFIAWNAFGTKGFDYDPSNGGLTTNVGSVHFLNGTIFGEGAVLDELYWEQKAFDGRLALLGGKVDMLVHFDTNRVANDSYSQFIAYSLQNNPSIPAPTYGGFGGIARVNPSERVYAMVGVGDSSVEQDRAPWKTLDNHSWYQLFELGVSPEIPSLGSGTYRLTLWHNHLFGADGFGVAFNFDQELGREDVVGFFRFGVGDASVTPVKTFVSAGVTVEAPFGREQDEVGAGVAWLRPSVPGKDPDETLVEVYYRVEIFSGVSISPDLQVILDPIGNPDVDVVYVPGVRVLLRF